MKKRPEKNGYHYFYLCSQKMLTLEKGIPENSLNLGTRLVSRNYSEEDNMLEFKKDRNRLETLRH